MTAAAKRSASPGEYDDAKLEALTEPLRVVVEKMVAGRPQPFNLPVRPGQETSGAGWTKDDVRHLQEFLPGKLGTGIVNVKVTDVNNQAMRWQWFFSPADFGPKADPVPAATAVSFEGAVPVMAQPIAQSPPAPPAAAGYVQDPYAGWLHTVPPPTPRLASGIPAAYASAGQFGTPRYPGGPMYPTQIYPPAAPTGNGNSDELRREREERLRLEADLQRKELENRYREQIGSVSNEVRQMQASVAQLAQTMQQQATARRDDDDTPQMKMLREQLAKMEREREQSTFAQLIASNQQQMTQLLSQMRADTDKQISTLAASIKEVAAKPSGPDPNMQMMMQMFQMQMQMLQSGKDTQLTPMQMFEVMRSMNTGAEQQATAFSKAWELMMQGVETILQAQGPAMHPALEMLGNGIQAAVGLGGKAIEERAEVGRMQAQAQMAQANANAQLAQQLQRQQQLAQQRALAGAQQEDQQPEEPEEPETEEDEDEESAVRVDATAATDAKKRDVEMFGPALDSIKRLRLGVKTGALDAEKAAQAIIMGVTEFLKQKHANPALSIPAFDLWAQGQVGEVIDLMLPDAKPSMRAKVVDIIIAMAEEQREALRKHQIAQREQG